MQPRTTGILLLVALALGVFVYFELEREGGDADEEGAPLFAVEASAVTQIELDTTDGRRARLVRDEQGWSLVSPVAFPADGFAADALASSLATLSSPGPFEAPGPLAEYELAADQARSVRFEAGAESGELRLGRDAPVGSKRYVAVGDQVHAVARYEVNAFEKSLDDLRNKDVLDFDRRRVRRIEAAWPGERVVLEAGPGPESEDEDDLVWRITTPVDAAADGTVVSDLLSELDFLRADGFVDEVPEATGLDAPFFSARLSGPAEEEGEEALEVAFAIGAELPDGARLVRGDRDALYRIESTRTAEFPRQLLAYRDKELARFAIADAQQVELFFQQPVGDPVSVVAERQGSEWASPSPEAMDPDRILPMVSELSRLSAGAILAESVGSAELEGLELSPPNTIISVWGEPAEQGASAPKLAELRLGRVDGGEGVVVQRPGDPILYRLPIEVGEQVPLNLDALRNRFLAPEPPEEEIPGAAEDDALLPTPREESP